MNSIVPSVGLTVPTQEWTTSIEGKPTLCCYYPEIKIVDSLGFDLVTVLWTVYSEKLVALFKTSGFLVLIFRKIAKKKCVFKAFGFKKMTDQVFFLCCQAGI